MANPCSEIFEVFYEQTNKIYESAEKLGLGTYENISTTYEILPVIPQLKEYLKQIKPFYKDHISLFVTKRKAPFGA